jgi:hypothetical protein
MASLSALLLSSFCCSHVAAPLFSGVSLPFVLVLGASNAWAVDWPIHRTMMGRFPPARTTADVLFAFLPSTPTFSTSMVGGHSRALVRRFSDFLLTVFFPLSALPFLFFFGVVLDGNLLFPLRLSALDYRKGFDWIGLC